MLEFELATWQDCILPEICDTQEMYADTWLILFAEDCDDTLPNTAGVACVHDLMEPVHVANNPLGLRVARDTVKRVPCHTGRVQSKAVQVKRRKKNHSAKTVSVLSTHFDGNSKPGYKEKQSLAKKTGMRVDQVSMWFNNKRKRTCGAAVVC